MGRSGKDAHEHTHAIKVFVQTIEQQHLCPENGVHSNPNQYRIFGGKQTFFRAHIGEKDF